MPMKTIRFTDEESALISDYAKSQRRSVSDVIRASIMDKIEDEYDLRVFDSAYAEYLRDPTTISHEEMMERYGLR